VGNYSVFPLVNRRRFLLTTVGLLGAPYVASAAPILSAGPRLRLVDAHTGATFDGAYRDAKGPIAHVMDQLDLFLRDRRTGGMTNIDVRVVDFLVGVMAAIGVTDATVLSAYRSLPTNAMLERTMFGVADNSQHLYGRAIDVSFPAAKLDDAVATARAMKRGGVGWYPKSDFIHLDAGPVRNWDLGTEGLQDALLKWPQPTPIGKKPTGTMLVEGPGHLTVGGGKPAAAAPGRTITLPHHRVAGLLEPLPKTQ
jgi:uncharacterized protein YcbK (DUF882 family)